ncbi:hypothetical protein J6590_103770, partial [Homalodisca vitripennis]
ERTKADSVTQPRPLTVTARHKAAVGRGDTVLGTSWYRGPTDFHPDSAALYHHTLASRGPLPALCSVPTI